MAPTTPRTSHITGEHFYRFFQCPHWIWYDVYGDQSAKREIPPLVSMIHEGGLKHSHSPIRAKKFDEIKPEMFKDLDEAFLATLNIMREGKNIYHGVLLDKNWSGIPDLLEAQPVTKGMKSVFGGHYYIVSDVRRDLNIHDGHKMQLIFYSLILERIQGVRPAKAYVFDAAGNDIAIDVEEYLDQFNLTLKKIESILNGEKPPPFLKSGCKQSPWFSLCLENASSCEDISLIYRLSQGDQKRLYDAGIKTVGELAETSMEELEAKFEDWHFGKIQRFHSQAQALVRNESIILKKTIFPESKTELYFDVEADPTEDIDYLLGVLIKKGSKTEYKYFWADDKESEAEMWDKFQSFLEEFDDAIVYHYSDYEKNVASRFSAKYGISKKAFNMLSTNAIDIHKAVVDASILPLYFYGLKDIARYLGFKWADDQAGGAESVIWYNEWQMKKNDELKSRILRYNEDDVKATMFVKEWLEQQRPRLVKESLE